MKTYNGKAQSGYYALCACLNIAMERGIHIDRAEFCRNIDEKVLKEILTDDNGALGFGTQKG
jgi:hypothetical protein